MRLEKLDLIRFGKFTGSGFEAPEGHPDFHLIVGRNEAGKTTTMTAIEDLLFGIPARTPYGFLHDYDDLRIGAVLASDGEKLAIRRRKGNRDTLLDEKDAAFPEGEGILRKFLGGVEREFFLRMFGLSHDRLAEGGREIVAAEGEVGEMLFAAGAALRGFRDRRKRLDNEATALWTPRRAKTRRFYQSLDRFTEADRTLRSATKQPDAWKRLKKDHDAAAEKARGLEEEYRCRDAEARRLARVRRVLPKVRRLRELDEKLVALADAVLLPEDAAARRERAVSDEAQANAKRMVHQKFLEERRSQRDAVASDRAMEARESEIRELEARRIEVATMRRDLPKRQDERKAALEKLGEAAADLGWRATGDESLLERLPSGAEIGLLSDLLQRRGRPIGAVEAAEEALGKTESRIEEQAARLSPDLDIQAVARLEAIHGANAGAADLDARLRELRRAAGERQQEVADLRATLSPSLPDDCVSETAIRALPTPSAEVIAGSRERLRTVENELEEKRRQLADARRRLRAEENRHREIQQDTSVIARSSLDHVRAERDASWQEVRTRLLDPSANGDREAMAGRFQELSREADGVADRRFDRAEAAGRLAAVEAALQERKADVESLAADESELIGDRDRLLADWRALWKGCPFEPRSPDEMATWIETREKLAAAYRDLGKRERELDAEKSREREIRDQLAAGLAPFGLAAAELEHDPVGILLRRAADTGREKRQAEREEQDRREAFVRVEKERDRERGILEQARAAVTNWEAEWERALAEAKLEPIVPSETGARLLTDMGVAASQVREVENRIGRMEQEIAGFEQAVRALISEISPELGEFPADEAVLRLHERLERDLERRKKKEDQESEIHRLEEEIRKSQAVVAEAEMALAPLYERAGTTDRAGLETAIQRSDNRRAAEVERARLIEELAGEADGLSAEEVRAECEGVEPDQVKANEEIAAHRLEEIRSQQRENAERLGESRKELEAFEDDDAAARLAATRAEAVVAVRKAAERYTRVRTAEILLRWALERFRKEKQEPMLRRAGVLFSGLTGGSFETLEVGFDAKDQLRLEAIRKDGRRVPVTGLSSGSEDQLYLALRIAAIEERGKRAPSLPFLADDLFVNFDEARSAAGFRILGDFARNTQVLFFTHHEHLVPIAREVLGENLSVIRLDES